jgi:hypothetical protein
VAGLLLPTEEVIATWQQDGEPGAEEG